MVVTNDLSCVITDEPKSIVSGSGVFFTDLMSNWGIIIASATSSIGLPIFFWYFGIGGSRWRRDWSFDRWRLAMICFRRRPSNSTFQSINLWCLCASNGDGSSTKLFESPHTNDLVEIPTSRGSSLFLLFVWLKESTDSECLKRGSIQYVWISPLPFAWTTSSLAFNQWVFPAEIRRSAVCTICEKLFVRVAA